MQNTMRAHSAGQILMEGGVDVNKGHMVYRGWPKDDLNGQLDQATGVCIFCIEFLNMYHKFIVY